MSLLLPRRLSSTCTGRLALFCHDLNQRGLVDNSYPSDILKDDILNKLPNVLYAGFDPTASSLHIGNLVIISSLIRATVNKCHSIAVVGGATALIGDPSGKLTDRVELAKELVEMNSDKLLNNLRKYSENAAELVSEDIHFTILNNYNWYKDMKMIDFLRLSRKFRVGHMLRLGHIKNRMKDDSGLSFTEFSYQILQSFDWKILVEKYNCHFQLGGSDQLGHLDVGAHYIKKLSGKDSAGICLPLLTDGYGIKIGKSTADKGEAVWLDSNLTSPYAFYQYFRQLHDDVAEKFLMYFSLKPIDELNRIIDEHRQNLGKWIAQITLAEELTQLIHGKDGLVIAKKCSNVLFNGSIDDLKSLDYETILTLFGDASTFVIKRSEVQTFGELADKTRKDKNRGSKLMTTGAFKVNGMRRQDPNEQIDFNNIILRNNISLLLWGKRKFFLIKWI